MFAYGKKKKPPKMRHHILFRLFLVVQMLVAGCAGYLLYAVYDAGYIDTVRSYKRQAEATADASVPDDFKYNEPTIYYDDSFEIMTVQQNGNGFYMEFGDIPEDAVNAVVATEDKDFWKHRGINYRGILRAAYAYIQNSGEITQGGSSITQQLVKLTYLSSEQSFTRKIKEAYASIELEKKYSKEQIMEFYMNSIYFANGCYGLSAACEYYFGKKPSECSTAQLAFLLAIPNSPTRYDPVKHFDDTKTRQKLVLKNMKKERYLTKTQYRSCVNEEIKLDIKKEKKDKENFQSYIETSAIRALMESDGFEFKTSFSSEKKKKRYDGAYDEAYAKAKMILNGRGIRVYTSLSKRLQAMLQQSVDETLSQFTDTDPETGIYKMQSAAVCIDNETGLIKAIVGARSQENVDNELNRAYQTFRQPGSTIKPLLVYTPAMELLGYTPETTVTDQWIQDGPKNSGGRY